MNGKTSAIRTPDIIHNDNFLFLNIIKSIAPITAKTKTKNANIVNIWKSPHHSFGRGEKRSSKAFIFILY